MTTSETDPALDREVSVPGDLMVGWVRIGGSSGKFPEYVIVLDPGAIQEVRQVHLPNFWPSEIKELKRLRADATELIDKVLTAKLIFGHDARIMEPLPGSIGLFEFDCKHKASDEHGWFYQLHPAMYCGRCYLRVDERKIEVDGCRRIEKAEAARESRRKKTRLGGNRPPSSRRGRKPCVRGGTVAEPPCEHTESGGD